MWPESSGLARRRRILDETAGSAYLNTMTEQPSLPQHPVEQLLSSRKRDNYRFTMGRIEIFWGLFNIAGVWLYALVFPQALFWALWIPLGVVIISLLTRRLSRKADRMVLKAGALMSIWAFALLSLPVLIVVFPLAMAWIGLAFLANGIFLSQPSQYWGAVVFCGSAPKFSLWPEGYPVIFSAVSFLGLVVTGVWCLREGREG